MDSAPSAAPLSQLNATGLANDTLFWFALGGAALLAGLGLGLCVLGLYRLLHPEKMDDLHKLEIGNKPSSASPRSHDLSLRFRGLLNKVKFALVFSHGLQVDFKNNEETRISNTSLRQTVDAGDRVTSIVPPVLPISFSSPELPEIFTEASFGTLPYIILSPPSSPSLVHDETTGVEDESGASLGTSLDSWDWVPHSEDCDDDLVSNRVADSEMVDALFDELEAYIYFGERLTFISKGRSSHEPSHPVSDDTSVLSLTSTLVAPNVDGPPPESEVPDPEFLEVPPLCQTQTERDAAEADSRYPRFVVTSSTIKRSALRSPVKVNWKVFKPAASLAAFISGIPLSSNNGFSAVTRGKTLPSTMSSRCDTPPHV